MYYTKTFLRLGKKDADIAGGKGASLGEMTNAKIPVPGGFVVLADSFEKFIELTDNNVKIDSIIRKVNHKKIDTIEQASKEIQALILNAEMPKVIASEINSEFKKMKTKYVAVRSSATSEDSADAAWAGQLDSFLNTTEKTLLENVKRCWASLFTPRAIFYRFEKGLHKTKISVAVVVQKMIASKVSGIAFSVHPVTEDYNQLIIEAGFGLGEAIVSGQITPDSYLISKDPFKILDKNINAQQRGLYRHKSGIGNEWKNITAKSGAKQCLSDKQILELSKLIIKIEKHYGFPCDIEWAYEKGKFYIVQSRPITTLIKEVKNEKQINKSIINEINKTSWYHLGKWVEPALAAETWLEYGAYAQRFFNKKLDKKILYLNGDFYLSKHDSDIYINTGYVAAKSHNTAFFINLYKNVDDVVSRLVKLSNKIKSVSDFLNNYKDLTGVWMPLNNIALGVEKFVQENDPSAFTLTKGYVNNKTLTVKELGELEILKRKIEKLIKKPIKSKDDIPKSFYKVLEKHVNQYPWLGSHHFSIERFDVNKLIEKIISLKNEVKNVSRQNKQRQKYLVWLLDVMGYTRFKSAEGSGITTFNFYPYLCEIAKLNKLTYGEIVEHTISEITNNKLSKTTAKKRKLSTGFYFNGKQYELSKNEIDLCKSVTTNNELNDTTVIKGTCAYKGIARGVVKIVTNKEQMKNIKDSFVMVSYETTPDVIFAMEKSIAVVTDFGGLTSHAAIVSRELKKPCIVGTKIATQVLKDGDFVEVDADNGVVRILESKDGKNDEQEMFNEIEKMVKDNEVDIQAAKASIFNASFCFIAYLNSQDVHGQALDRAHFYIKDEYFTQISVLSGLNKFTNIYYQDWLKGGSRFKVFLKRQSKIINQSIAKYQVKSSNLNRQLKMFNGVADWWKHGLVGEDKGKSFENEIREIFVKKNCKPKETEQILSILATPEKPSVFIKERKLFYQLCLDKLKNKLTEAKIKQYIKEYFYIETSFYDYLVMTPDFVKQKIKNEIKGKNISFFEKELMNIETNAKEIKSEKKNILNRFKFSNLDLRKLSFLHEFSDWLNTRKENMMKSFYYFADALHVIAKVKKISFQELSYYTYDEVVKLITNNIKISKDEIKNRKNGCFVRITSKQNTFVYGDQAKKLLDLAHDLENKNVIKGKVAYSAGKITGKVKIISDPATEKFTEGEILVTSMTRIEFVPLMKKAKAIITDEGGISCHAAIVSRELHVPRVIGTKVASKLLHDGDIVEIDTDSGVVKIIK